MGSEVRAGRDAGQCTIVLNDGRVSSVHATLKVEAGHLYVRDEGSNNGSSIDGAAVAPGTWTPVRHGGVLRFGPLEFSVKLEA
jgi:predicted component of type VI protein secretion system